MVLALLDFGTVKDVSQCTGLAWHTVKGIEKKWLKQHYSKPRLKDVRYIAIDEFAVQKGHKYMTVVMDLESNQVLYVAKGKKAQSLDVFWKRLRCSGANVEGVSIDMSPAYIKAIRENLPHAKMVFDWFHIVKMMNDQVDNLRRQLVREEDNIGLRSYIKGTRWLLLKHGYNIDKDEDRAKLDEAFKMNLPLATMYYMKEELQLLWEEPNKMKAETFLTDWCNRARSSGIKQLVKVSNSLMAYRTGLLNWFDTPISSGKMEGINNKIKVLKRKAYGFRDIEYFKLKILGMHDRKIRYALIR